MTRWLSGGIELSTFSTVVFCGDSVGAWGLCVLSTIEWYDEPNIDAVSAMKPKEYARQNIDQLLEAAGWKIQDLNLSASLGVAIHEFPLKSGFADYLLFVEKKAVGVIEAKPEGVTLSGTADQSDKYLFSLPQNLRDAQKPHPFAYESTGTETFFSCCCDSDLRFG